MKIHYLLSLLCIALASNAIHAKSQRVNNLSEVEAVIQNPHGKAAYSEQMNGTTPPKPYQELPVGVDAVRFLSWLAPNENPDTLIFSGIKRWQKDNQFIATACFNVRGAPMPDTQEPTDYACSQTYLKNEQSQEFEYQNKSLYLGAFTLNDGQFTPIATSGAIDVLMADDSGSQTRPNSFPTLDLAPYKINDNEMAFGLRAQSVTGYAGGGAIQQNLILFRLSGQKLQIILNTPIYEFRDIAGNWNKDGTREHNIEENDTIVIVQKNKTNGFYDLMLKTGHEKTILKWDGQQYQ